MRMTMTRAKILLLLVLLLAAFSCSRKGDDPVPERKGDLRILVQVDDETGRLGDSFPVKISLFDDTLHQFEIGSKRIMLDPQQVDSVSFTDLNARSAFYYVEVKIDFHNELDATCGNTPVFVEDGVLRRVGVAMLYRKYQGQTEYEPDCSQF